MLAAEQLLELSAACNAASRHLKHRARTRLELAVAEVLGAAKAQEDAAHRKLSPDQALQRLRRVLQQCRDAGVDWSDVVAVVNREDGI